MKAHGVLVDLPKYDKITGDEANTGDAENRFSDRFYGNQRGLSRADPPIRLAPETEEMHMRVVILSALMGLGIGLAGIPAANAAPISGLSSALESGNLVQDVQYYGGGRRCRAITVCRRGPYGRRCHVERVCRRGW